MRDMQAKAVYDKKWHRRHKKFQRVWRKAHKSRVAFLNQRFHHQHPEFRIWASAKDRAKKRGVPFTILRSDIVIPERCPVLGMELKRNRGHFADDSPSLDCVIPQLGYIQGNIAVMSLRANRIKSNASAEEIKKVAEWLEKQHSDFLKHI